jgi:hypothetical protein
MQQLLRSFTVNSGEVSFQAALIQCPNGTLDGLLICSAGVGGQFIADIGTADNVVNP